MGARHVYSHRDRLLGLVGHHDALAHPTLAFHRSVHWRKGRCATCGRLLPALGAHAGFGAFLQAPRAAANGLLATLGYPLGVALLRCPRRPRRPGVLGARPPAALLRRELRIGAASGARRSGCWRSATGRSTARVRGPSFLSLRSGS
jgi:hypothetical protein